MPNAPIRRNAVAALATAFFSVTVLSGCSLLNGPTPDTADRPAPEAPTEDVSYVPDGTAEDNLPVFTKTLVDYGQGDGAVQGEPIERALTDVGFVADSLEVTQDLDPFGNPAESIFVSSRFGNQCLVGQITASDREVVVEQAGTIGPNDDQCLIVQPRS